MRTDLRLRVTGFDGRSRIAKSGQMYEAIQEDWEKFFENLGDMTNLFRNLEPIIEQANRRVFESGLAGVGKPHKYWASKHREYIGQDPDGPTLLSTGELMNSFRRLRSRSGKQKTLSYGFTAPYAAEVLTKHNWTVNYDPETGDYDPSGVAEKTLEVPGRDYTEPVFDRVSRAIMDIAMEMKWNDIQKELKKRGK